MKVSFELLGPEQQCESIDICKFIRLSIEFFPELEGLATLEDFKIACKNACLTARKSEEYVLIIRDGKQWVRTVVVPGNLHSKPWIQKPSKSDCIIHSNTLLYYPYWSQLRDKANTRVHFPSNMLEKAFAERKSLKFKFEEWMNSKEDCTIGMHKREPHRSTSFTQNWEIKDVHDAGAGVKFEEWISEINGVSKVIWRGGTFVQKEMSKECKEFEVVKRVSSHPNIVYGFGEVPCVNTENRAYFMEYMKGDLLSLIVDESRGVDKPPFSPLEALDILLQFGKAMEHMHQEDIYTVHCDLKSENVLISKIATSENASHYLVKVADFGHSLPWEKSSAEPGSFPAGNRGTIQYSAPEVLLQQMNRGMPFGSCHPEKIDVYSFGIVAYEVITGENYFEQLGKMPSRKAFKTGVVEHNLRPPLREKLRGKTPKEFIQDEKLLSVIEACWLHDPAERPSFVEICECLNNAKVRILEEITQCDPSPSRTGSVGVLPTALTVEKTRESRWLSDFTAMFRF